MNDVKFFTPQKANQTLPLVKKIVDDILNLGKEIREMSAKIGTGAEENPEVIAMMDQLDALFEELEGLGCSYKDWNFALGLVDFPAIIDDEEVYLCWRSDEPSLKYYHGLEEGFTGRKEIPEKYLKEAK
jgi:hypothetical protein